jgi:AcrR family transcriptional regulator
MMQNLQGNEDLRVRRTRKLLQSALMELTIRKGFEAVTVQELCEQAMVNRATFYRHYTDKYDLIDQYMHELYTLLEQPPGEESPEIAVSPPLGLVQMLEHLQNHASFYRVMLGPKGYALFGEKIRLYMEKRFMRSLPKDPKPVLPGKPPAKMILRCISSAGLGAIIWWLENDNQASPEQMAAWAVQFGRALLTEVS